MTNDELNRRAVGLVGSAWVLDFTSSLDACRKWLWRVVEREKPFILLHENGKRYRK